MNRLIKELGGKIKSDGFFSTLKSAREYVKSRRRQRIGKFSFPDGLDIRANINSRYGFDGELLDFYIDDNKSPIHKWHHYIPLYDRYFSRFRGGKVRFLEIGVSQGGSLHMWRRYFGGDAIIYGIDINPECMKYNGVSGQVRIGSQADHDFLLSVINEMGGVDIVLDDGSHKMEHIVASLNVLFPVLNNSGVYFIEDLHTAYWRKWGGGYNRRGNFFNMVRALIDDMHHWYHIENLKHKVIGESCSGIHVHDSIVVLDKNDAHIPFHSHIKGSSGC